MPVRRKSSASFPANWPAGRVDLCWPINSADLVSGSSLRSCHQLRQVALVVGA